jgi:uncharacterized membrane protein YidH (DUF202 family)
VKSTVEQNRRSDAAEANRPASQASLKARRSLIRLLLALIAVIVLVLAMWGRMQTNATSTVNPQKSQPAPGR